MKNFWLHEINFNKLGFDVHKIIEKIFLILTIPRHNQAIKIFLGCLHHSNSAQMLHRHEVLLRYFLKVIIEVPEFFQIIATVMRDC